MNSDEMTDHYSRTACRLCTSKKLDLVLPLNQSPLCDAYITEPRRQDNYDLSVYLCRDCNFVQITTVVDPKIIYREYLYQTTSSSGLTNHFSNYANEVCESLKIDHSKLTVDIGSNDGTLLEFFRARNHRVLGIEPAAHIARDASLRGIETLPVFFDESEARKILFEYGSADLITINNLFANVDNLENFTRGLEILLSENGVLVIESSYLLEMIENMVFDFIYHEHLSYFSIFPLITFFKKFDLQLIRLQEVSTKGGSLRYFWARENSKWSVNSNVERLIERERKESIGIETFGKFWTRIEDAKSELNRFLQSVGDKKIVAYGASATSTTLIYQFELERYIYCIVDDNPSKHNLYSPGCHIPVLPSEVLYDQRPEYVLLLAWRYLKPIMDKHTAFVQEGGRFIVPLPEFQIIGRSL